MPVHHRLRFLTFPMRTSRLCSLWPDMRPLRFRRAPFGRDVAFDPGGATASRIAMPHMLPSTVPSVSASAKFFLSWLNPTPHPITVYASHPPSPTTAQHSLPGGALPPYRGRSFTGRNASASPDAPEPEVRIHLPPAQSPLRTCPTRLRRGGFRVAGTITPSERGRARRPTEKRVRTDRGRDGRRYAETRPPTPPTIARHCRRQCPRCRARFHSGAAARRSQGRAGRACPSSNRCARSIAPHRRLPHPERDQG